MSVISPASGKRYEIPKGTTKPSVKVTFTWKAKPAGKDITFSLWHLKETGSNGEIAREAVYHEAFKTKAKPSILSHEITEAGNYEWEILSGDGGSLAALGKSSATFQINPKFEGIKVDDPLVGGMRGASNEVKDTVLDNFDITLNWKAFPGAKEYRLEFFAPDNLSKPLKTIVTQETFHSLNKGKIFTGRIAYRITAKLAGGFEVGSGNQAFVFDFLPPRPVQPEPGAKVSQREVATDGILFTWQKTNFTDSYDLEIATDAQFKHLVAKENLEDNFMIVTSPGVGSYWWRTRSHSKGVTSAMSPPAGLTITP